MVRPGSTEGRLLAKISGQLDELIGILRPEPPAEPTSTPTAGEPEKKPAVKKAPAKKAARKRVTGQ